MSQAEGNDLIKLLIGRSFIFQKYISSHRARQDRQ